ncbi:DEAD/DEAH box helicase [Dactylosporangium sp. NPDC048998]|uniref:DEAD/DEAH box helicase n=1 Tax=Dactylosporangium sp. NPDC048998 TaxID=3363976 RepID=UPI003715CCDA
MERSLDLALLRDALAGRTNLPSAEELQQLIADVEVHLFLRDPQIAQELLDSAWYLHAVASIHEARERYTLPRQRQAFLVSAHIFDLALNQDGWGRAERLSFGFAAAIGYRRGGRDPNGTAIMNRLRNDIDVTSPVTDHIATLSLEAGLAFLGFETRTLFRWFGTWRRQLNTVARDAGADDLTTTALGPSQMVVLGAEDLLMYLATGRSDRLETGVGRLRMAAVGEAGPEDLHSRWVANHLLGLSREAQAGSLWNPNVLPPDVSALVRQSFTMGSPPVMTLWEPQRALLTEARSPFDPYVLRMVLAVPTSGGKTLVGQLLAVEHIDRTDRSVCYVVPTRSLGREVRRAMSSRVRVLQKETGAEQADFSSLWGLFDAVQDEDPADVEVMTPERLAHLLRHDAAAVLDRFGLFIFDEAQLLKETGRGFTLEAVIALLDYLTAETDHKIVLISAAMGNAGEIAQWLDPAGGCLRFESQWRGPRRLHAAFTTTANWNATRVEGGAGRRWRFRHTTPLTGYIRLRLAENRTAGLTVTPDVEWVLVQKSEERTSREKVIDNGRTTKKYMIASETITLLGHAGSVLVVATTRAQAQQIAEGIAGFCEEQPGLAPLVDFVRQQLSDDHPLVGVLKRGVGFHHAGLPVEVLEALEGAVRDDMLPYLTCTSTLTDGVNLPVRTVVIYDQPFPDQSEESRLSGARLVNAMGRAGRAGKETEGWIVLVRAAGPTEQDFHDLNPSAESLAVTSSLITDEALDAFANLEDELRATEDAIFTTFDQAGDFISFVWLVLSIEEGRGIDPADVDLAGIVDATLAARQSPEARQACAQIAATTRRRYLASEPQSRRRWARTGTSIGSARAIDTLATRIASAIQRAEAAGTLPDLLTPASAIRQLPTLFTELLDLAEAPAWQFKVSPRGDDIAVRPVDLLADWVSGQTLPELANTHLTAVTDPAFRIEQMVGAASENFEHFLAWTVGAVVDIVNTHLLDADAEARLCPELAGYIRYGVDSPHALRLMTSGIRSRRLAHAISRDRPRDLQATHDDLRAWLAGMGITEWRDRYDASASEVLDLLDYTRLRSRSLLKTLLETGSVTLDVLDVQDPNELQDLAVRPVEDDPEPARIAVSSGTQPVAYVSAADHTDVQAILDTGLAFEAALSGTSLRITLPLEAAGQ